MTWRLVAGWLPEDFAATVTSRPRYRSVFDEPEVTDDSSIWVAADGRSLRRGTVKHLLEAAWRGVDSRHMTLSASSLEEYPAEFISEWTRGGRQVDVDTREVFLRAEEGLPSLSAAWVEQGLLIQLDSNGLSDDEVREIIMNLRFDSQG